MLSKFKTRMAFAGVLASAALMSLAPAAGAETGAKASATGARYGTQTSAELLGKVEITGAFAESIVRYRFEYGTGPSASQLTSKTPWEALPTTPAGLVPVGQIVTGLNPSTHYWFNIEVERGNGVPSETTIGTGKSVHSFLLRGQQLHFELPHSVSAHVGSSTRLNGHFADLGSEGVTVELRTGSGRATQFTPTGITAVTGANGSFSIQLPRFTENTGYRLVAQTFRPVESPVVFANATVTVRFQAHIGAAAFDRLSGSVSPSVGGAKVEIQQLRRSKSGSYAWITSFVTHTNRAGRFSVVEQISRGGRYRAFVALRGGRYSSGASGWIHLHGASHTHAAKHHHKKK